MGTTQHQSAVFDAKGAERFAALWAGWDTWNASEPEAMSKGRAARRMVAEKGLRIIDALELPEIRQALDDQMQPIRQAVPDVAALRAEAEDLRGKLALVVPKLREVAEALKEEKETTVVLLVMSCALGTSGAVIGVILGNGWLIGTDAVCLLVLVAMCFLDGNSERRCMDTWQMVKEKALLTYVWASQIGFGLNALLYIACCVVAGGPVGPVSYIGFLYHCCQWKVG
jgi:hypothetical protein